MPHMPHRAYYTPQVIIAGRWVHVPSGRTASVFTGVPWRSPGEAQEWRIEPCGYTIQGADGRVVDVAFATREEAEEWLKKAV
jgi:hypothetical protein